jgi:hypothetical protein
MEKRTYKGITGLVLIDKVENRMKDILEVAKEFPGGCIAREVERKEDFIKYNIVYKGKFIGIITYEAI